jgi:starvation-inducible outer membrane lipoprotein
MPALILLALLCSGCVAIPAGAAVSAIFGVVSTVQRQRDREAQIEQTAEIRKLREAIEARWPELPPTDR